MRLELPVLFAARLREIRRIVVGAHDDDEVRRLVTNGREVDRERRVAAFVRSRLRSR